MRKRQATRFALETNRREDASCGPHERLGQLSRKTRVEGIAGGHILKHILETEERNRGNE